MSHSYALHGDRLKGKGIEILSMFVPAQVNATGSIFHYSLHMFADYLLALDLKI